MKRIPPEQQTAQLKTERRAKGKLVTVIVGLDAEGNDLSELARRLKNACGAGVLSRTGRSSCRAITSRRLSKRSRRSATRPKPAGADAAR